MFNNFAFLLATLALVGVPASAAAQADDPRALAEERERKAQEIWDQAEKLEKEGKLVEARARYRELRNRYSSTRLVTKKIAELLEKLNDLGTRVAVTALGRQTLYKKPHVDSWLGYELQPPDSWFGIPPAQGYFGDQDNSEDWRRDQLERASRYTSDFFEKIYLNVYKHYASKDIASLEARMLDQLQQFYPTLKEEGTATTLRGRTLIPRRVFSTKDGDRMVLYLFYAEKKGFGMVGTWRAGAEDNEIIVTTTTTGQNRVVVGTSRKPVEEAGFEHALKIFDQVAKTFWIYDQGTKSGRATALNNGARCSDWNVMASSRGNYIIEYATTPEFAKRVGDEMEFIHALYRHVMPTQKAIPKCRIKVFDREEDFGYYGRAPGSAAYFSPYQEEIVCYRFGGTKVRLDSREEFEIGRDRNPEEVTFQVLYHEGFHQYIYFMMGRDRGVYIPSWLNEGLGDYFFGGRYDKAQKKFVVGINDWRVKTIVEAVKQNKHIPFRDIIKYTQMDYYNNARVCYAQGWAMNYFFLSPEGQKKGYHTLPQTMINKLKTSGNADKARIDTFGNVDLKKIEEEWKTFVLNLPVPPDPAAPADAVAAPPNPARPAAAPSAGTEIKAETDLLKLMDLKKDFMQGPWTLDRDGLTSPETYAFARVKLPVLPPEEYDFKLVVQKKAGTESLTLGLVAAGQPFVLILHGWGGTTSGIETLDGKPGNSNETTTKGAIFTDDKPRTLLCKIRRTGFLVEIDDKTHMAWKGDWKRVTPSRGWGMPDPPTLFIGSYRSSYAITQASLTPVTGAGKTLR